MFRRTARFRVKSVGPDGFALRVSKPSDRTWTGVRISSRKAARTLQSWTSKFLEFFGNCGASRMLMAVPTNHHPSTDLEISKTAVTKTVFIAAAFLKFINH
jgi:hypothetical protein